MQKLFQRNRRNSIPGVLSPTSCDSAFLKRTPHEKCFPYAVAIGYLPNLDRGRLRPRHTLYSAFMPTSRPALRHHLNVAAIVQNSAKEILICERIETDGAWQFPQGSLEKGESAEEALQRELWEEIGLKPGQYRIVSQRGPYRYLYGRGRQKKGYDGKEQTYFLVQLTSDSVKLNLEATTAEFQAYRWIRPEQFQEKWLPKMKREVYRQVFQDFFGINLAPATQRA
jgi:putative (di)nucleoside polyphosphate hydrolase